MSFGIVMEGMTVIAYIVIMAGGKQKRESGWKVLAALHVIVGVLLGAALSIIVSHTVFEDGRCLESIRFMWLVFKG